MWIELFALILSYSGIFAGYFIGKAAKEEVAIGKKNLKILELVLRLIILIVFFVIVDFNIVIKISILVLIILVELILKNTYIWLGIIFGLNPVFLMSSLIFLHGFPKGSLMYKEKLLEVVKKTYLFLVFAIIGFLIKKYVLNI
jgi:hypothetical protein